MRFSMLACLLLLLPGVLLADRWTVPMEMVVTTTSGTDSITLHFGVNPRGTDGFDFGVDQPVLALPTDFGGYFPIADDRMPLVTRLTTDIRSDSYGAVLWEATYFGLYLTGTVRWDAADLPASGNFSVGQVTLLSPDVLSWADMRTTTSQSFTIGGKMVIRYRVEGLVDTIPPYCSGYYPVDGATNIPVNSYIEVQIKDNETGIDQATLSLALNGSNVTSSAIVTRITGGYKMRYVPTADLDTSSLYTVHCQGYDMSSPQRGTQCVWTFNTSNRPTLFAISGNVTLADSPWTMSGSVVRLDSIGSATTGTFGGYEIRNIHRGTYNVTVTHTGYRTQSGSIAVNGNQTADFVLYPESSVLPERTGNPPIRIYPNPVLRGTEANVHSLGSTPTVRDLLGRSVPAVWMNGEVNTLRLATGDLMPGLYWITNEPEAVRLIVLPR